jgi:hypothetical protein
MIIFVYNGSAKPGNIDVNQSIPADGPILVSVREFRFWQLVDVIEGFIVLGVAIGEIQRARSAWGRRWLVGIYPDWLRLGPTFLIRWHLPSPFRRKP